MILLHNRPAKKLTEKERWLLGRWEKLADQGYKVDYNIVSKTYSAYKVTAMQTQGVIQCLTK